MPAADEVWRLQTGHGPECQSFQAMAEHGHYRQPGQTRQGIYVCTPSGKLLASINSLDPVVVCKTLEAGLAAWDALPHPERRLAPGFAGQSDRRWERSLPRDGFVLESVNRDLSDDPLPQAEGRSDRWNRDHVWLSGDEARRWLPPDPEVDATHRVPDALVERLVRFHLVDNVRGQTLPFARADVAGSRIDVRVISRDGPTIALAISGGTQAASGDAWGMSERVWTPEPHNRRGVLTRLVGRATYDLTRAAFVRFELVALGQRWGSSQNSGRGSQPGSSSIGFFFTLAADGPARAVPPAFIDVYDAAWLERP